MRLMDLIDEQFDDYNKNKFKLCMALERMNEEGEEAAQTESEPTENTSTEGTDSKKEGQPQEPARPKAYILTYSYPSKTNIENLTKLKAKLGQNDIVIVPEDRDGTMNAFSFVSNGYSIFSMVPELFKNSAIPENKIYGIGQYDGGLKEALESYDIMMTQTRFSQLGVQAGEDGFYTETSQIQDEEGQIQNVISYRIGVDTDLRDYDAATNQAINKPLDEIIKLLNSVKENEVSDPKSNFHKDFAKAQTPLNEFIYKYAFDILSWAPWNGNTSISNKLNQESKDKSSKGSQKVELKSEVFNVLKGAVMTKISNEVSDFTADFLGDNQTAKSLLKGATAVLGAIGKDANNMFNKDDAGSKDKEVKKLDFKSDEEKAGFILQTVLQSEKARPLLMQLQSYVG